MGESLLSRKVFDQLTSLRAAKSYQIQEYFKTRIWYAAQRNNLSLHHYRYEYSSEPIVSKDSPSTRLAQNLNTIPVFVPLTREQGNLEDLTKGTLLQHFGAGEKVIRQGEPGHALYIIITGQAVVTVADKFHKEQIVMTLSRSEFFGEMVMFSGEPNPASVTAVEDLEVMVIYSNVVNTMIERQPSLAREIGQIIEARRKAIDIALATSVLR